GAVVEIPAHRPPEAALEALAGLPAELAAELHVIDRIAQIVTRPVLDEADELGMRAVRRLRQLLGENGADLPPQVDVAALGAAADIVGLADSAATQHKLESASVVLDEEPVADIGAGTVDRQRLALDGVEDDERDELLGKLVGPVIVRAVG